MTSFFAQLLLKLQEYIAAQVPEIKWIDQDLGQLEDYEIRPAVAWPCVLIDFGSTNYDEMPGNVQWGYATVTEPVLTCVIRMLRLSRPVSISMALPVLRFALLLRLRHGCRPSPSHPCRFQLSRKKFTASFPSILGAYISTCLKCCSIWRSEKLFDID